MLFAAPGAATNDFLGASRTRFARRTPAAAAAARPRDAAGADAAGADAALGAWPPAPPLFRGAPVLASDSEEEAFTEEYLRMQAQARAQRSAAADVDEGPPPSDEEDDDYALQIALAESQREYDAQLARRVADSEEEGAVPVTYDTSDHEGDEDAQHAGAGAGELSALLHALRTGAPASMEHLASLQAMLSHDTEQWAAAAGALHAELAAAGASLPPGAAQRASAARADATARLLDELHADLAAAQAAEQAARAADRAAAQADSRARRSIWEEQDRAYAESLAADEAKAAREAAARAAAEAQAAAEEETRRSVEAARQAQAQAMQRAAAAAEAALAPWLHEPAADDADACELVVDISTTGGRLRRRFALSGPASAVYAAVRLSVAQTATALDSSDEARALAAAQLLQPGALRIVMGFPPFAPLEEGAPSLVMAGVPKRERLIARLAE